MTFIVSITAAYIVILLLVTVISKICREKNYKEFRHSIEQESSPPHIKQMRLEMLDAAYLSGSPIRRTKNGMSIDL